MSVKPRRQQPSQGRLPGKAAIRPSDEKQVSTKPPPPLAGVSEIACLCFTFSCSRMMITLSGGHFIRQSSRRKAWAFSAQRTKIFPREHRATEEYIRGIFVDPRHRWGAGESTTETQSEFLPHCGIRTGRRDGRRGDRSPNLAAERKQRYPYVARRIEY